jgi:hypothetical protein
MVMDLAVKSVLCTMLALVAPSADATVLDNFEEGPYSLSISGAEGRVRSYSDSALNLNTESVFAGSRRVQIGGRGPSTYSLFTTAGDDQAQITLGNDTKQDSAGANYPSAAGGSVPVFTRFDIVPIPGGMTKTQLLSPSRDRLPP